MDQASSSPTTPTSGLVGSAAIHPSLQATNASTTPQNTSSAPQLALSKSSQGLNPSVGSRGSMSPGPLTPKSTNAGLSPAAINSPGTGAGGEAISQSNGDAAGTVFQFSDGTTRIISKDKPKLPDKEGVTVGNLTNSYVDFVGFSDSSIDTSDPNTLSHLDKKLNAVPRTEGKIFTTWSLFECVKLMHNGELSNWSQLVGKLGVSDISGRPQYAQRCKRWLQKYRIDCFFDYLLGNPYDFFNISGEYSGCLASRVKTVGGAPKKSNSKTMTSSPSKGDKTDRKRKRKTEEDEEDGGGTDVEEEMGNDVPEETVVPIEETVKKQKTVGGDDEDVDMLENSSDDEEDEEEDEVDDDDEEEDEDQEDDDLLEDDEEEEEDQLSPAESIVHGSGNESERTKRRIKLRKKQRSSGRIKRNHPFSALGDASLDRDIQQALDMYEHYQKSLGIIESGNGTKNIATGLAGIVPNSNGIRSPSLPNGFRNILNDDNLNQDEEKNGYSKDTGDTKKFSVEPPSMLSDFAASLIMRMRTSYSFNIESLKSDLDFAQTQLNQTREDLSDSEKDLQRLKVVYLKKKAQVEELEKKIELVSNELKQIKEKHDKAVEMLVSP